jgi:hypothetical protein
MMFRQFFKKDFHASLWSNMTRVGLLSERAVAKLAGMGITPPQQAAAA